MTVANTFRGSDGRPRCRWCAAAPEFEVYHDIEWGFPVADDQRLFEKLCLEGFQSGLSWRTILAKRENFRRAFDGFDFHKIARDRESRVDRLLQNEGIVRHRGKIEAVINNAQQAVELSRWRGGKLMDIRGLIECLPDQVCGLFNDTSSCGSLPRCELNLTFPRRVADPVRATV